MMSLNFTFPLYKLREHMGYKEENNILYVMDTSESWKILDNRNLTGTSLASRRMHITKDKYELNNAIFTFSQLLKRHRSGDRYITSLGYCFVYKKSIRVPLKYYEVLSATPVSGYGVILHMRGLSQLISIPAGFNTDGYIGLLEYNGGYLLYDMPSMIKKEDTWRKI